MSTLTVNREDAIEELRKFFQLSSELGPGLTMFSEFVDHEWHELLSNQEKYEEFCATAGGVVFGHVPSGPMSNPIVTVEWVRDYEIRWGTLPLVWFASQAGVVDENAYRDYLDSREIVASWKCNPSTGSVAKVIDKQ